MLNGIIGLAYENHHIQQQQEFPEYTSNQEMLQQNAMALTSVDIHEDVTLQGNVELRKVMQDQVGPKTNTIRFRHADGSTELMTVAQARAIQKALNSEKKSTAKKHPINQRIPPSIAQKRSRIAVQNPIRPASIGEKNSRFIRNKLSVKKLNPSAFYGATGANSESAINLSDDDLVGDSFTAFVSPTYFAGTQPPSMQAVGAAAIESQQQPVANSIVDERLKRMRQTLVLGHTTPKRKAYVAVTGNEQLPRSIAEDTLALSTPEAIEALLHHY